MRHKRSVKHFGRPSGHRKAMIRNLVSSLVEYGRIRTTVEKAKELRRHVERAITMGKKGDLAATRVLLSRYPNKATVRTIMKDLSPRFKDRNGGYTRVLKTGRRPGDSAEMAIIEFVDYELPQEEKAVKETVKAKSTSGKKVAEKKEAQKKKAVKKAKKVAVSKKKTAKKKTAKKKTAKKKTAKKKA